IPRLFGHFQGVRLCGPFAAMDGIGGVVNTCGRLGTTPRDIQRQQRCGSVGAEFTDPIKSTRGLRQGCPLSPLLFILYIARLETALEDSRLGFKMCYGEEGRQVAQRIPALIYVDDVVLMAGFLEELQKSLDTRREEGTTLGLTFNLRKSAVREVG
ncbi:reverse transcriptase, putative, partial [Ixodes scapularis]